MASVQAILQQGLTGAYSKQTKPWGLSRLRNECHLVNPLCCHQFTARSAATEQEFENVPRNVPGHLLIPATVL